MTSAINRSVSTGHKKVERSFKKLEEAWQHSDIPQKQLEVVLNQIKKAKKTKKLDNPFRSLITVLKLVPNISRSLLEVGCSSGYNNEVIKLGQLNFDYSGCDYSREFIKLAKKRYPKSLFKVCNATGLKYPDSSYDVVLLGGVLLHIRNYKKALREAVRVARDFVIIHRNPTTDKDETMFLEKRGYGLPMLEIVFNKKEMRDLFRKNKLFIIDSQKYNFGEIEPLKAKIWQTTYLLRKIKNIKCSICNDKMNIFNGNIFDDRYGASGSYAIYKCFKCGFMRTDPVLDKKEIGDFYTKYYPMSQLSSDKVKKQVNIKGRFRMWMEGTNNIAHLYITPDSDVLDIGSASGVSLLEIEKLGGNAHGVEPDPRAQKIAQKFGLRVYEGFISDNPFKGKKFDFITASQVIEHEPNPKEFLKAVKKKLNKGGMAILSFPTSDAFYRKIFGKKWIHWHVPYHINHFTRKSINILAKEVGFEIIRTRSVTPNLWTMLQLRVLFNKPTEGIPNPVWAPRTTAAKRSRQGNFIRKFTMISLKYLIIPITVLNRILDIFGQGESLLIFLKNGKNESKK